MALEQKLSLKLAQKLVMTPSLQQAIKLLQMTRLELEGVLAQELVENPVLEESDVHNDEDPEAEAEEKAEENLDSLDEIDVEAYFREQAENWEGSRSGGSMLGEDRQGPPLENTLTRQPDLYDHLLWQLHMMDVPAEIREIAELIIGNLDPEGFLVATVEEIQAMGAVSAEERAELGSDVDLLDAVLQTAGEQFRADAFAEPAVEASGEPAEPSSEPVEAVPGVWLEASAQETVVEETVTEETAADEAGEAEEEAPLEIPGGYSREAVERALELVRGLDPPGVACASLQESLLRQLEVKGYETDSLTCRAISCHWELFKHRKFDAVAKELGVPLADLEQVVENIRELDTRPGRVYGNVDTQYVEPDVHVVRVGEKYVSQLNDDGMPRLRVSGAYRKLLRSLKEGGRQGDAQQYIKDKMRSALWLIKSLDQRQRTIYKVADSIVRQQRAFLDYGIDHLRPMVLRDVAEDIEMHESTVSRVVSNKYIHTPRGLYPMKFFFHSGIDREYGGDISSLSVKRKIRQLIQEEDSNKPLSDSELMRILKREGIQIARRTVAKYRDEMDIPSSTDRKKIF